MAMPHEIVIARYAEDLDWVSNIPEGFEVVIVNKGAPNLEPCARPGGPGGESAQ